MQALSDSFGAFDSGVDVWTRHSLSHGLAMDTSKDDIVGAGASNDGFHRTGLEVKGRESVQRRT